MANYFFDKVTATLSSQAELFTTALAISSKKPSWVVLPLYTVSKHYHMITGIHLFPVLCTSGAHLLPVMKPNVPVKGNNKSKILK